MKRFLALIATACVAASALAQDAAEQKKIITILNSVGERLWSGDIKALDDVKALPGDHAVAGLLMFFKQHFYVYSTEKERKAIAKEAAIYITECPTADDYIKRLFKKDGTLQKSGMLVQMREATLDALTDANNSFAVRLLFELMDESNIEVRVSDFTVALAKMNIAGAPYSRDTQNGAGKPDGIAKWREWWAANKSKYAAN